MRLISDNMFSGNYKRQHRNLKDHIGFYPEIINYTALG